MSCTRLVDNGANTLRADDGPDKERDASSGNNVSFDCEQVTNLVHGEPNCWQRAQPEDEERDEVPGVRARVGDAVRDIVKTWLSEMELVVIQKAGHFGELNTHIAQIIRRTHSPPIHA